MAQHERRPISMTEEQAVSWLRNVDGELYRTKPGRSGREAWVAVVRAPGAPTRSDAARDRLIVALGETLQEAASAAAHQWRDAFREVGTIH
jgi:hypothetical protein